MDSKDSQIDVVMDSSTYLINKAGVLKTEKLVAENDPKDKRFLSPFGRQLFAASGTIVATISAGMTNGFSAIALPQLKQSNSTIIIDADVESWIAGIVALPMPVGGLMSGVLMEKYGRRFAQMACCYPWIVGWLAITFATNVNLMYVGRLLTGFCIGLSSPSTAVYIAETSEPRYRGFILSLISLGIAFGVLLVHILGAFFDWRTVALISSAIPISGLVLMYFSPETPNWLARRGQFESAEKAFSWLRTISPESKLELKQIFDKHAKKNKQSTTKLATLRSLTTFLFLKPFTIISVFFVIQQFSGANTIIFYCVDILEKSSFDLDEYAYTIVIDTIRVIMSAVACVLLKKYGRRPLFVISSFASILCILALAASLKLPPLKFFQIFPVILISGYIIFSAIGLIPLPWMMAGEIFPESLRDLGSGMANCFAFIMIFVVVKSAPFMFTSFGMSGTFTLYGVVTLLGTIFLCYFLPETSNKTLQDVEDSLTGGVNSA